MGLIDLFEDCFWVVATEIDFFDVGGFIILTGLFVFVEEGGPELSDGGGGGGPELSEGGGGGGGGGGGYFSK